MEVTLEKHSVPQMAVRQRMVCQECFCQDKPVLTESWGNFAGRIVEGRIFIYSLCPVSFCPGGILMVTKATWQVTWHGSSELVSLWVLDSILPHHFSPTLFKLSQHWQAHLQLEILVPIWVSLTLSCKTVGRESLTPWIDWKRFNRDPETHTAPTTYVHVV